ncbi:PAS domain S-box protein [Sulfurimonas sp.]|nr:PAS domain S-box protein [Sulfurimonas sp.]
MNSLDKPFDYTFKNFVESAPVLCLAADSNFITTYVNPFYEKIHNITLEQAIGKHIRDIIGEEGFHDNLEYYKRALKGYKVERKGSFEKIDGSVHHYHAIYSPIYTNKEVVGLTGVVLDITSEVEIEKQKEFTQTLIDTQHQMIITTNGKELVTANERFYDFFAVDDVNEFMESYDARCICDTFNTNAPDGYLQVKMGRETWIDYVISHSFGEIHKAMITRDGNDFIFSVTAAKLSGNEGLKSAVFTDITDMEKAQTELSLEEKKFRSLTEGSIDSIMRFDGEYRHLYVNPATAELTGIPAELFLGKTHEEMGFPLDFCKTLDDAIDVVFQTKESHRIEFLLPSGIWIDWMLFPEIDNDDVIAVMTTARDITKQKENEIEINDAKNQIEDIHRHTQESIEYASLIQGALIPDNTAFKNYFQDYFAIWHPKDVVGGDIYLFEELRDSDECLLMVIDCTGHGVAGAFVTMLVKAIERQIIAKINNDHSIEVSPAWILAYFNRKMKQLLNQHNKESMSNAGFDGGVIYFNKKENILKFAGAETPLFYIEDEELKMIKGNRHSIGYKTSDSEYEFKDHIVETRENMSFYLTTDGYLDQNGGEKSFPFGKKRFKAIIEEYHTESMADQQGFFLNELEAYQGDEETNDDVAVVGFKI